MIAKGDLLADGTGDDAALTTVASEDVVGVSPDDTVLTALQRILEEDIEHLPVLVGDELVGICTRTDILRARRRQFDLERAEQGWRPRRRPTR